MRLTEMELTGKVYKEALKYQEKTERSAREASYYQECIRR
jgi:preprotein translocase subunit SecA